MGKKSIWSYEERKKEERKKERKKVKICLLDGLFCALPFCGLGKTHSNSSHFSFRYTQREISAQAYKPGWPSG